MRHAAPGVSAAFDYQFERALYWLARSPAGFRVGIETDDDVAVNGRTTERLLEQDKHSISDAQPFGDRSRDLWNTLRIWVEAVKNELLTADAVRFVMATNKSLPDDCLARRISAANSKSDIAACIAALKKAVEPPPAGLATIIAEVLSEDSTSALKVVIAQCELIDGSQGAGGQELRESTIAHLQFPSWCATTADSVVDELLGWLHKNALRAWQSGDAGWLSRDDFVNQFYAILDRRRRQLTRERAEHLLPIADDALGKERARIFVRQLHLVTEDDVLVDTAIREFIRCNIEKSRLSSEGNVTDEDWNAFEASLLERWVKIRARIVRMRATETERDVGFEILMDTTQDYRERLAGNQTEHVYLTAGTYHRLADIPKLGWHPRFEDVLREDDQ